MSHANMTLRYNTIQMTSDYINSTNNDTGKANGTNRHLGRDENLALIEISVQAVILALTIGGNSVLLTLLLRQWRRAKLSRMYYFFMHLCIADLCVGFFNILPQLAWDITFRFQGNNALCKIVKYLQITSMYASTYVLCMTAIDRFLAICFPLISHKWSSYRCHVMVSISWGLALAFAIPMPIIFNLQEVAPGSDVYDCWETLSTNNTAATAFTVWYTMSIWVIPTLILFVTYFCITRTVFRSMRRKESTKKRKNNNNMLSKLHLHKKPRNTTDTKHNANGYARHAENGAPRAHVGQLSNAKIKTVKLTICVVLAYIICWSPLFITQIWWTVNPKLFTQGGQYVLTVLILLSGLNSCTNPWIYFAFNGNLRMRFRLNRMNSETPEYHKNSSYTTRTHTSSVPFRSSVADSVV